MISVENKVELYEIDGNKTKAVPAPTIIVHSHWNDSNMIVLDTGDKRLTVKAADLLAAIANATNTARV